MRSSLRVTLLALLAFAALQVVACTAPPAPRPPPPAPTPVAAPTPDFRASRPPPGPEPAFVAPRIEEARLENGMRLLIVPRRGLPIVAMRLVFDGGAAVGPPGVARFAAAMLLRGTTKRSAAALSDALLDVGFEVEERVDYDAVQIVGKCMSDELPRALGLLAEMAQRPAFAKDEIERERSLRLAKIDQQRERPGVLASNAVMELLYPPGHPYASPLVGTAESVKKIARADLEAFHRLLASPRRVTLVLAGDVDPGRAVADAERAFAGWVAPPSGVSRPEALGVPDRPGAARVGVPKILLVDRPGASQSSVNVAAVGVARTSADYDAVWVMNAVLGWWDLSNRLFMNLREAHAYSYGAGSTFDARRVAGPFEAESDIARDKTSAGLREMLAEIARMRTELVGDDELDAAKKALTRELPRRFETAEGTAKAVASVAVHGLRLDEFATLPARWAKVTREDVRRAAAAHLDPSALRIVVVGDAREVRSGLEALALGELVVRPDQR